MMTDHEVVIPLTSADGRNEDDGEDVDCEFRSKQANNHRSVNRAHKKNMAKVTGSRRFSIHMRLAFSTFIISNSGDTTINGNHC